MADPADTSIGDLVKRTVASGQRLIQAQKALLQSELQRTGEQVAVTSVFAVIAIGTISLFTIFLLITIAYVFVARGQVRVNDRGLGQGDALALERADRLVVEGGQGAEILVFDLAA